MAEKRRTYLKHGIEYLYYITHLENLNSIARQGLLSHERVYKHHKPRDISNPEVQERRVRSDPIHHKPLHEYVPLYFHFKNPMLYRLRDRRSALAVLCLDSRIMLKPRIIFTDGNAASSGTAFYNNIADLGKLDWECIWAQYWTKFEDGKRKRCAEVLVPEKISFDDVQQIVVCNDKARTVAQEAASARVDIQVQIKPEWFFWHVENR